MRTGVAPSKLERGQIDHEAVAYVALQHPLVSFVYFLDGNDFDVGGMVVLAAEVEHFLGLPDSTDLGTGQAAAAAGQRESRNRRWLVGKTDHDHAAIDPEKAEIVAAIHFGRDRTQDEIERTLQGGERARVRGRMEVVGTQALGVELLLEAKWLSTVTSAPLACARPQGIRQAVGAGRARATEMHGRPPGRRPIPMILINNFDWTCRERVPTVYRAEDWASHRC